MEATIKAGSKVRIWNKNEFGVVLHQSKLGTGTWVVQQEGRDTPDVYAEEALTVTDERTHLVHGQPVRVQGRREYFRVFSCETYAREYASTRRSVQNVLDTELALGREIATLMVGATVLDSSGKGMWEWRTCVEVAAGNVVVLNNIEHTINSTRYGDSIVLDRPLTKRELAIRAAYQALDAEISALRTNAANIAVAIGNRMDDTALIEKPTNADELVIATTTTVDVQDVQLIRDLEDKATLAAAKAYLA